ncbi:MAG: hypothetical protein JW785_08330, partial [Acidimicrobiia bacterium]|nr:hypothetical protein [Acidimicrobiia bacterium]
VRDFMLLGLWGTNTPNLRVALFENEATGRVRGEVRFAGRAQIKRYRPDEDRAREAALARLMLSQFGPLVEPSLLRALGTFAMAAEESRGGSRVQQIGTVAFLRQSLEVVRETVRTGVRGTLVDLATALEVVVNDSIDFAQRGLDRVERRSPPSDEVPPT